MKNEKKSIHKLVEVLGGHWGRIGLEKRYEYAERALYHCHQKQDESADSFLARADIMWSELNAQSIALADLQSYITLRGSTLSSEDKKRVLLDADQAGSGKLDVNKVASAIRMLGAGFFHDVTGAKKSKGKTYDHASLVAEGLETEASDVYHVGEADEGPDEDELFETLMTEGDSNAILVAEFEEAATDLVQGDEELASALNSYTEARRRLTEKFRSRGFWPISQPSKGKGSHKSKVKGKFKKGKHANKRTLEQRILTSRRRICDQVGHWKAECPERPNAQSGASMPTSYASAAGTGRGDDVFPLEFMNLPMERPIDESQLNHCTCQVSEVLYPCPGLTQWSLVNRRRP